MDTRTVRQQSSTCHTNIVSSANARGLDMIKALLVTKNEVNSANQAKTGLWKIQFQRLAQRQQRQKRKRHEHRQRDQRLRDPELDQQADALQANGQLGHHGVPSLSRR